MTVPGNGDFFLGHSNGSNGDGPLSDKLRVRMPTRVHFYWQVSELSTMTFFLKKSNSIV